MDDTYRLRAHILQKQQAIDIHFLLYRGFTRLRYALQLLLAMAFSDLQKTQLLSLSMGAAFSAANNHSAYRTRVNPLLTVLTHPFTLFFVVV